jgi:hypothetical protein
MEEWRINDRSAVGQPSPSQLSNACSNKTPAIEVPHFRMHLSDFSMYCCSLVYLGIYLIPIGIVAWLIWRASLKVFPVLRRNLSGAMKPATKDYAS